MIVRVAHHQFSSEERRAAAEVNGAGRVRPALAAQPGFHATYYGRTGRLEAYSIAVWEDRAQGEAAAAVMNSQPLLPGQTRDVLPTPEAIASTNRSPRSSAIVCPSSAGSPATVSPMAKPPRSPMPGHADAPGAAAGGSCGPLPGVPPSVPRLGRTDRTDLLGDGGGDGRRRPGHQGLGGCRADRGSRARLRIDQDDRALPSGTRGRGRPVHHAGPGVRIARAAPAAHQAEVGESVTNPSASSVRPATTRAGPRRPRAGASSRGSPSRSPRSRTWSRRPA